MLVTQGVRTSGLLHRVISLKSKDTTGPKGETGLPGDKGEKGYQGQKGIKGNKGNSIKYISICEMFTFPYNLKAHHH